VNSKIKLAYLLGVASMSFGGASVHASDNSKFSDEQRGKYEACITHLNKPRGNEAYEKCLRDNKISKEDAKKLSDEMFDKSKNKMSDTRQRFFSPEEQLQKYKGCYAHFNKLGNNEAYDKCLEDNKITKREAQMLSEKMFVKDGDKMAEARKKFFSDEK